MNEQNKSLEQNMARLEQIVRAMERGDVPLEESLKLFQEGTELVRSCGKLLDEAEPMDFRSLSVNWISPEVLVSIFRKPIPCGPWNVW